MGSVDVALTCVDQGESGCAHTYYSVLAADSAGTVTEYSGPIHITTSSIVSYRSVDAAGNEEYTNQLWVEVLPAETAPHLRIRDGVFSIFTPGDGLPRAGVLILGERMYLDQGFFIGDAVQASLAGEAPPAITGAGQPLSAFQDEDAFQRSGVAAAVIPDSSTGSSVSLFTGPRLASAFPLRFSTPGPISAMPYPASTLPAATLDVPDMPVLLGFSNPGAGAPIRFTGSLFRGSLGAFDRVALTTVLPGTSDACEASLRRDSAMLEYTPGPDVWSDVVVLVPEGDVARCLAAPREILRIELVWEAPVADWIEGAPSPLGPGASWRIYLGRSAGP